ncbi:phosphomannomutase [Pseudoalteromonas sp. S16_S37]|uniref:phosphomannomutase n=1 Tax=Pseudoalteromonas sp. S16_S37 TaxID=2720228 RepID=UPI0016804184|nr:phosphomannomutase [Pseudoalteromonas sp. S16_S37]MBD1584192.1 phosphomannomutase [Pseudoalteromonas sp. S16_S37]
MVATNIYSNHVIAHSGVAFGTSGARGLVTQFTPQVCGAFTLAFVAICRDKPHKVAIAMDNRPSSPDIVKACVAALKAIDIEVEFYGVVPTPALAYAAQQKKIPAIMVTGSHIPFERNGIKFYSTAGEISKVDEQLIINVLVPLPKFQLASLPTINQDAQKQYINRYIDFFPSNILQGKRVGIYLHSSAGRYMYEPIFSALGAEVVVFGHSDDFIAIDTEAVSDDDRQNAKIWSEELMLDALFTTDGDGDRPLLADEKGEYIAGDILGLLAAQYLEIKSIAMPINCNTQIESCGIFKHLIRTKIGSPYVIAALNELANSSTQFAGFEANGGFLLGSDCTKNNVTIDRLMTRDAVLPVLCALALSQVKSLSQVVDFSKRFTYSDRDQNIDKQVAHTIIQLGLKSPYKLLNSLCVEHTGILKIDDTDGLRITLDNDDIIHLRPSGNAPELRCYAESSSLDKAKILVKRTLTKVAAVDLKQLEPNR